MSNDYLLVIDSLLNDKQISIMNTGGEVYVGTVTSIKKHGVGRSHIFTVEIRINNKVSVRQVIRVT